MVYKTKNIGLALGLILMSWFLIGCQEEKVSSDPGLSLRFSTDSVCFDTVFNHIGSSTRQVMVYNPNKNAIRIDQITLKGEYFHINFDGENNPDYLRDITINGGDSLFLFIRVNVTESTPILAVDTIRFFHNSHSQYIALEAYGLNAHIIRTPERHSQFSQYTFREDSSYLIFDTLEITGKTRIEQGASLYMHQNANMICHGGIEATGTYDKPIRIVGDRTDKLFTHVPYRVASGQWGGIYLFQAKDSSLHRDTMNYVEILSGNIGLYCQSEDKDSRSHISISNCRIHNHSAYGIILMNTDADIWNCEISNCASYCLYLQGGRHILTHNTIASYFGWPNSDLNIHNVSRDDVAAVYINNLSKETAPTSVSMRNCIVTGIRKNNIVVATPLPTYYDGEFAGNYLKADTLPQAFSHNNVYANDSDVVFVNTHYMYKEYIYYNFHLDSISPARFAGDSSLILGMPWQQDRDTHSRLLKRPDAGCYEWVGTTQKK